MSFRPATTLKSRTFIGLLIAQFLAAFNDQAIHASAMFFALRTGALNEAWAITLMPILFYSPWAIVGTIAGYLADRFSKRTALVTWKLAEIGITGIALYGFWLGSAGGSAAGPWVVLGTVFLMGMHSAFFVPAKYGVMPEILTPQLLSRGNGLLESLSFLAIILGTVFGGLLSDFFKRRETVIGVTLVALAVIGAIASFLIEKMPAANPGRKFPPYVYGPLIDSMRMLLRAKPLRLAVAGIAFFTFVVAYMRATVYLLGECQNPRWNEFKTSVIVGMSALGIGLGAPLAGWLSGRKVELGLVPIGAVGMMLGVVAAAVILMTPTGAHVLAGLIACIILVGFCTGFYLVPLYTVLQHRAPKTSKGDAVATSNFINVIGAIVASGVTAAVVFLAKTGGVTPEIPQTDVVSGKLVAIEYEHGRPVYCVIRTETGTQWRIGKPPTAADLAIEHFLDSEEPDTVLIHNESGLADDAAVTVSRYAVRDVAHYVLRPAGAAVKPAYDLEPLPRYLFLGAGLVTLLTLVLLYAQMPDLFQRMGWFLRSLGRRRLRAVGAHHVPLTGPVILATNCQSDDECRAVLSATDRPVRFIHHADQIPVAEHTLARGELVGLATDSEALLPRLHERVPSAPVIPTYFGPALPNDNGQPPEKGLRVSFGKPIIGRLGPDDLHKSIRQAGSAAEDYHAH